MLIHTKPISKLKLSSAISYALITLLTPVISVVTNYSSALAVSATTQEDFNFTVRVNQLDTLQIIMPSSVIMNFTPEYGTAKLDTEDVTIQVNTTNNTGYRLYMTTTKPELTAGFTLDNGSTPVINTLSNTTTGITSTEFSSNSNTAVINKWGYTLTKTDLTSTDTNAVGKYLGIVQSSIGSYNNGSNGATGTNASTGSTIGNTIIDDTAMILNDHTGEGTDTTIITFAANLDAHQPAGDYSTTLTFTAITNNPNPACPVSHICYDSNGVISDSKMDNQEVTTTIENNVTTYDDTTLWASNFKNPSGVNGYGFAGWNTKADGTGTNYGPNETISPGNLASQGLTLYANWIPADKDYTMQTFSQDICSVKLSAGEVIALRDIRDNNVYAIAKLADNKCWMIENLRLDNTATLSPTNTNVASDWGGMVNNYGGTVSNHLTAPGTSADYWCTTANANCYDQSRLANQNVANPIPIMSSANGSNGEANPNGNNGAADNNIYSYGNYYNWYSTTAGSGTYGTITNPDGTTSAIFNNTDTAFSICPTGWRLPNGGSAETASRNLTSDTETYSDFYNLGYQLMNSVAYASIPNTVDGVNYSYYSSITGSTRSATFADKSYSGSSTAIGSSLNAHQAFLTYPNNFLLSGLQYGVSVIGRGADSLHWSSTVNSVERVYHTLISQDMYPGTYAGYKHMGLTVRCLAGN